MQNNSLACITKFASVGLLLLVVLALALCPVRARAAADTPESLVIGFHDVLLSTMKEATALGVKGRYQRLEPAITHAFHLRAMIQIASGGHWRNATEAEKNQLTEVFSRLTIATYAAQFDGYSGQNFVLTGSKPGPQETTLVETKLVNPDGSDVALVYVTRLIKGQWRTIDVLLDTGISELARKRSEYRQILKSEGVAGLVKTLSGKTELLLAN
ncbi:MAG: ABC transporter substrate-binding protein [Rhodospirillales bacterium]|nr:ABC transporter substrate-binding protein [Rhodospirillales bacterium]